MVFRARLRMSLKRRGRLLRLFKMEFEQVRAGNQVNSDALPGRVLLVVLGESLANLVGRHADDGIGVAVVVRVAAEDLNAECALFDAVMPAIESEFDHAPHQSYTAVALAEGGIGENAILGGFWKQIIPPALNITYGYGVNVTR